MWRVKIAPSPSGCSYLRDRDGDRLALEGHSTCGHFEVFQQQLLAGDHVIPKNLGHEALLVPVFDLEKKPGR